MEPAIGWTGQVRLRMTIMPGEEHVNCQAQAVEQCAYSCCLSNFKAVED